MDFIRKSRYNPKVENTKNIQKQFKTLNFDKQKPRIFEGVKIAIICDTRQEIQRKQQKLNDMFLKKQSAENLTILTKTRQNNLEEQFRKQGGKILDLKGEQVQNLMSLVKKQISEEKYKNVFYDQKPKNEISEEWDDESESDSDITKNFILKMIKKIDFIILGEICFPMTSIENQDVDLNNLECVKLDKTHQLETKIKEEYISKIQNYFFDAIEMNLPDLKKLFEDKEALSDKWLQKSLANNKMEPTENYRIEVVSYIGDLVKDQEPKSYKFANDLESAEKIESSPQFGKIEDIHKEILDMKEKKETLNLSSLQVKISKKRDLEDQNHKISPELQKRIWEDKNSDSKISSQELKDKFSPNDPDETIDINGILDGTTSKMDSVSIYFDDHGQEQYSHSSSLHRWKPDYNLRKEEYWDKIQHKFSCAKGSGGNQNDDLKINKEIIKQLEKMQSLYELDGQKGKAFGYRKAISMLKTLKEPLKSVKQLDDFSYIGDGIKKKVHEFLVSGSMQKVEFLTQDQKLRSLEELAGVWGVGPNGALKLYNSGVQNIKELREKSHLLNKTQLKGLKYHDDIIQRIQRPEVEEIFQVVKIQAQTLFASDLIVETCGSYRRGKQSSGDVDILISPNELPSEGMLDKLLTILENQNFIKDRLSATRISNHGSQSFMGICQLQKGSVCRRLDIKIYPRHQLAFALLYFTGSAHFNRSMRLFAQKKGYSLSDEGLHPVVRGVTTKSGNAKIAVGNGIPCETEEDIFKALHLPYKTPQERDI